MSTKLYNGYRLPMMSIPELHKLIMDLRTKLGEEAKKIQCQRLANVAYESFDSLQMGYGAGRLKESYDKNKEKFNPMAAAFMLWLDRSHKLETSHHRDPEYDLGFEICLMPIRDHILVTVYTETQELTNIWEQTPGVEPYPYWNNTDPPDDMSEEEWDKRRDDWNEALPGIGVPARCGFCCELTFDDLPVYQDVVANAPTFEDRIKRVVANATSVEYDRIRLAEISDTEKEESIWKILAQYTRYCDSEEGKAVAKQVEERCRQELKPVLTINDLTA